LFVLGLLACNLPYIFKAFYVQKLQMLSEIKALVTSPNQYWNTDETSKTGACVVETRIKFVYILGED
jgi:hypothetical protein